MEHKFIEAVLDSVYVQERVSRAFISSASSQSSAPRTSYDRYYEGRKAFGSITSQVRILIDAFSNHSTQHLGPQSRALSMGPSCLTTVRRHHRQHSVD